jgi:hypothetical protein
MGIVIVFVVVIVIAHRRFLACFARFFATGRARALAVPRAFANFGFFALPVLLTLVGRRAGVFLSISR